MGIFDGIKKAWDRIFGKDLDKAILPNKSTTTATHQQPTSPQPPQSQPLTSQQQPSTPLLPAGTKLTYGLLKQNASFEGVEELTQNKPLTDDEIKKKLGSVQNPTGNLFLKINFPLGTQYVLDNGDKKTFLRPEKLYPKGSASTYENRFDTTALREQYDAEYVGASQNNDKVVQFPTNTKLRKWQKEEYIKNNTKVIGGKRYAEINGEMVEVKKDRGFFNMIGDIFNDDDVERLEDSPFNLTPEEKKRKADEIYKSFDPLKANKEKANAVSYELYKLGDGRGQEVVSQYNKQNPKNQIGFWGEMWTTAKLAGDTLVHGTKSLYRGFRESVLDDSLYRFKDLDTLPKEQRQKKEIEKTKKMFDLADAWNKIGSDSSISEDEKQSIRNRVQKEFNSLNVVGSDNLPLKIRNFAKAREDETATNKASDGYHKTALQKVGFHDELSKTNNVFQEEEFYQYKTNKLASSLIQTQTIEAYKNKTGQDVDPKIVSQLYNNSVLIDILSNISYMHRDFKGTDAENFVFELKDRIVDNIVDYVAFSEKHKNEKNIDAYTIYPEFLKQGGTDFLAFDSYSDIFSKYSRGSTKGDLFDSMVWYGHKLGLDNALKDITAALRVKHSDWYNLPVHVAGAVLSPIETTADIGLSHIENKIFSNNDQDVYLRESASMINTFGDMIGKPLPEYEQIVNNQRQKKGEWVFTLATLGLGGATKSVIQGSVHLTRNLSHVTKAGKVMQKIFPFLDDTMTSAQRAEAILNSIRQGASSFVKEEMFWQKNNLGDYGLNDLTIGLGGETLGMLFSYMRHYNRNGMDKELSRRTGALAHYLNSVLGYTPKELDSTLGRMTQTEIYQAGGELLSKFKEFSDNIDRTTVSEFKKTFKTFTPQAQIEFQKIADTAIKNSENRILTRAVSIADKTVSKYVKSYKDPRGNLFVKWNFPKDFSTEKIEKIKNKITDIVEKRSNQSRYSIITSTRNFVKSNSENIIKNNRKTKQLFFDNEGNPRKFVKYNGQKLSFKDAKAQFIQDEINSRLLAFNIGHRETPTKWLGYFGVQDDRADNFAYLRRFHSLVNAKIYEKDLKARKNLNNLIFNNHYYGAFEYYLKQYYNKKGAEFPGFDSLSADELQKHIIEFSESVESLYLKDYLANAYLPQDRSILVDDVKIANKTFNNAVKENPELKTMGHDLYNKILGNSSLSLLEKEAIFRTRKSIPYRKFNQVYNVSNTPMKAFNHTIDSKLTIGEYGYVNIVSSDDFNIGKQLKQKDYSITDAIRSKLAYGTEYKYRMMGSEDGVTLYSISTKGDGKDSVTVGTMKLTSDGSISIVMKGSPKFHSVEFNSAKPGEILEIDKTRLSYIDDKVHIDVSIPEKKQLSLSSLIEVRHDLENSSLSYKKMIETLGEDFSIISPSIFVIIAKNRGLTGMQKLDIFINMVKSKNITETASGILLDLSKPLDAKSSPVKNSSILVGVLPTHGVVMIKDDTAPRGYLQKYYSVKDATINLYDHPPKATNRKLAGQIDVTIATPSAWTYEHGTKGKKVFHSSDATFLSDSNKKSIDVFFETLGSGDHNVKIRKADDYNTVYQKFYGNNLSMEAISKLKNTPGMSVQRFANHLADRVYGKGLGLLLKRKRAIDSILLDKTILEYANAYRRLIGNADVSNKELIEAATYVARNIDSDFTDAEEELISILYPHAKEISPSQSIAMYLYQKYGHNPKRISQKKIELLKQRRERILLALYKDSKMIGLSEEQQFKLLKKSKYLFGSEESIKQYLKQDPEFVYNFLKDDVVDIKKTIDEYSIPDEVYQEKRQIEEKLTEITEQDNRRNRSWKKTKEYNEVQALGYDMKITEAVNIREKIKAKMGDFALTPDLYEKAQGAIEQLDEIISAYSIVKQADTGNFSNIVDYAHYKEGVGVPQSFIYKQVSLVDRVPGLRLIETDGKTGAQSFDFLTAEQKDKLKDTIKNVIYDVSENGSSNAVYWAELNSIVFNPKYLEATTISHEVFHAAVSFMGDQSRRYKIYKEVRDENGADIIKFAEDRGYTEDTFLKVFSGESFSESKYKEWITEEWLAERFGEYVAQKDFSNGKLKSFFKELWERIRLIFTNKDALKLFDEIYSGTLQYSSKGSSYGILQQVKYPINALYDMVDNLVSVINYKDLNNAGTNKLIFRPSEKTSVDLIESVRRHIKNTKGDEITSDELAQYFDKRNVGFGNILFQNFNGEIKKYYGDSAKEIEDAMIKYFSSKNFKRDVKALKSIGERPLGKTGFRISAEQAGGEYLVSLDYIGAGRLFFVKSANVASGVNQIKNKIDINSKGKAPFLSMVHDVILQSKKLAPEQLEAIKEAYKRDVSYLIRSFYPTHKKYDNLPSEDVEILKDIEFLNTYNAYIPHHSGDAYGDAISFLYEEKDRMTFDILDKILKFKSDRFNLIYQTGRIKNKYKAQDGIGIIYKNKGIELSVGFHWASSAQAGKYSKEWQDKIAKLRDIRDNSKQNNTYRISTWNEPMLSFDPSMVHSSKNPRKNKIFGLELQDKILKKSILPQRRQHKLSEQIIMKQKDGDIVYGSYTKSTHLDKMFNGDGDLFGTSAGLFANPWTQYGDVFMEIDPRIMDRPYEGKDRGKVYPIMFSGDGMTLDENGKRLIYAVVRAVSEEKIPKETLEDIPQYNVSVWAEDIIRKNNLDEYKNLYNNEKDQYEEVLQALGGRVGFVKGFNNLSYITKRIYDLNAANAIIAAKKQGAKVSKEEISLVAQFREYLDENRASFGVDPESGTYNIEDIVDKMESDGLVKKEEMMNALLKYDSRAGVYLESYLHRLNKNDVVAVHIPESSKEDVKTKLKEVFGNNITIKYYKSGSLPSMTKKYAGVDGWGGLDKNGIRYEDYEYATALIKEAPKKYAEYKELFGIVPTSNNRMVKQFADLQEVVEKKKEIANSFKKRVEVSEETRILKQRLRDINKEILSKKEALAEFKKSSKYKLLKHIQDIMNEDEGYIEKLKEFGKKTKIPERITGKTKLSHESAEAHIEYAYYKHGPLISKLDQSWHKGKLLDGPHLSYSQLGGITKNKWNVLQFNPDFMAESEFVGNNKFNWEPVYVQQNGAIIPYGTSPYKAYWGRGKLIENGTLRFDDPNYEILYVRPGESVVYVGPRKGADGYRQITEAEAIELGEQIGKDLDFLSIGCEL